MSLIVYDNGILLADRLAVRNLYGTPYKCQMQKLHVNDMKYYAFAYSGEALMPRHLRELNVAILTGLAYWTLNDNLDRLRFGEQHMPLFSDRAFIIMTREHVFSRLGDNDGFVENELTDWAASGTFLAAWRTTRSFGYDAVKAAREAIRYVAGEEPTIDFIKRTDLKPFPTSKKIKAVVKKRAGDAPVPPQLKKALSK